MPNTKTLEPVEKRILILSVRRKDDGLTQNILKEAGIESLVCADFSELCAQLQEGAGAVLLPEEGVTSNRDQKLHEWLLHQPQWSDLPLLVVASPGADSEAVGKAIQQLGNVTVLERPMRIAALVSAVKSAIRARERQYQIRDHLTKREEIEAKLRADDKRKDEFLATLAHELRNPLAPIRNSVQILKRLGALDDPSEEIVEMMERQVNHMVRLVDDLLEVSRISTGKIHLRKEVVDLASILTNAIETSMPSIEGEGHQLEFTPPPLELKVMGDPIRLAQVFSNLLNNAAKYTEKDGHITITVWPTRDSVQIAVSDDGTGISPETISRVFEMFAQIDGNKERAQGGLGIGLTLVKSLVEMHGGSVKAHSPGIGHGSRFTVTLPLVESDSALDEKETQPDKQTGKVKILIADDSVDGANTLGILLKHLGADVQVTYSGKEALTHLEPFGPTAVILDIGMPEMDGHETARRIRATARGAKLTLIALTGWGQEEDRIRSKEAGFDHHMVKPVELAQLEKLLGTLVK